MKLEEIFERDITRPIETVIKADDRDHVFQEVEEYVVTNEIALKIQDFFAAYNDYQGANGVWISGFFGSGKSHLLKILSYVMENREHEGQKLGEVFAGKVVNDAILKANVLKATRTPSESILFNIDQQAQITTKQDDDAILNVFYKVLNDHLGFYGAQGHVADFERWLTAEGAYVAFITKFEEEAQESWISGRRKYFSPKIKSAIDRALTSVLGPADGGYLNIIDTLRRDSSLSIENFSTKVDEYIKSKPKGFRLNFFVDEVGQYISDNTKLMLNLQTITESLASRTKGQAWVLVTSQEDMEKVVGDMNKAQQNDFSRIQARFKIKVPLSSANVDEVIEKRLLQKKENATKQLAQTWQKEHANLETLLTFSEVGVQFKGYKEVKNFTNKYPFVPYQFDLFQQCIKALSHHNAFQGKHAAVGERSMLGVFQDVVMRMGNAQDDALVTFDLLYEGIRSTIRGEIQSSVMLAERNLEDSFAIKVLKALFLVKYYSNFKTTPRNISVLMIDNIHIDLKAHEQKIHKALALLEAQTYVQRNGDLYVFLTDDEKDIEEEIKGTDIDESAINQLLDELTFDEVIRDAKIKYIENKQDYEFAHKIDGNILGRDKELVIDVITPNHDDYEHRDLLAAQSMGRNTMMMVVLPPNERLLKDVRLYLKTDKYIKQSQSTNNKESIKRLLYEKGTQNSERRRTLILLMKQLLGEADILLNGSKYDVGNAADGRIKVTNAFQGLVKIAYPNLKMLGTTAFSEDTTKQTIKAKQNDLFGTDDSTMSEPENEVLNHIIRRKKQSERTSLSDVKDQFVKKPYGWSQNAIWTIVARLYKRGKLEVRQDGVLLGNDAILAALSNNRLPATTLLEPQEDIDPKLVRALKEVYNELFDQTCSATEAKEVATAFRHMLSEELAFIKDLVAQRTHFPFLASLEPLRDTLDKLGKKEPNYLLLNRKEFEDELLDGKENLLDPIKRFWNGEQKKIYEEIKSFCKGDLSNFEHIEGEELAKLEAALAHNRPYAGTIIQEAKAAMDSIREKVLAKLGEEKEKALSKIKQHKENLKADGGFQQLTNGQQEGLVKQLAVLGEKVTDNRYISNIRGYVLSSNELFVQLLNEIQTLLRKNAPQPVPGSDQQQSEDSTNEQEPKVVYVRRTNVEVTFKKSTLETEQDVEDYVTILKQAYIQQIKENKRITL